MRIVSIILVVFALIGYSYGTYGHMPELIYAGVIFTIGAVFFKKLSQKRSG